MGELVRWLISSPINLYCRMYAPYHQWKSISVSQGVQPAETAG